jgi:tetratricopeptide (TPR) repeat protein
VFGDLLFRRRQCVFIAFDLLYLNAAAILTALGFLYYRQGKLVESERILRRSLDIRRKIFGPTHSSVALTSLIIAGVLTAKGQYEEAKLLYADSLQAEEQNFGPRSLEVATTRRVRNASAQDQ